MIVADFCTTTQQWPVHAHAVCKPYTHLCNGTCTSTCSITCTVYSVQCTYMVSKPCTCTCNETYTRTCSKTCTYTSCSRHCTYTSSRPCRYTCNETYTRTCSKPVHKCNFLAMLSPSDARWIFSIYAALHGLANHK